MRDTLGGRPFDTKKVGDKIVFSFYPMVSGAKNPDAIMFRLTLDKADLKKIAKFAS